MTSKQARVQLAALACVLLPQVALSQTPELIQVGTHRLELVEAGQGAPTIVVEAGLGADWRQWSSVIDTLATMTKVVGYARAGYSRSDTVSGTRTAGEVADDLYVALKSAGLTGPYILLGHSYGGILVRIFAGRHPGDTAGMLLVDPSNPAQVHEFAKLWPEIQQTFTSQLENIRKNRPATVVQEAETFWSILAAGSIPEASSVPDVPTIVITSTRSDSATTGPSSPEGRRIWRQLHDRYLDGVTLGAHVLTGQSGHNVHVDQPALIIDAARQLLEWVR